MDFTLCCDAPAARARVRTRSLQAGGQADQAATGAIRWQCDLRMKAGDAAGAFGHPTLPLGGRHEAAPEPRLGPDRLRAAPIAPLRTEG
ncbi:MAG: hypothetical protein CL812_01790 [Confluentimicrobium sp.]|nr:hypothetical protein [Actibacterium sp.]